MISLISNLPRHAEEKKAGIVITHFCQDCQVESFHTLIETITPSLVNGNKSESVLLQCQVCQAFTLTDITDENIS